MRFPFAGALRAAATLMIVVYHAWGSCQAHGQSGPVFLGMLGQFAVACFFALSGFLLSRSYLTALIAGRPLPSWSRFARSRFLRIYPLFAFAVIALAMLSPWLPNANVRAVEPFDVLTHLSFTFTWVPNNALTIDPPMWTMATDVQFYCALPFMFWLIERARCITRASVPACTWVVVGGLIVASIVWRVAHATQSVAALDSFALKTVLFNQLPGMFAAFGAGIIGSLVWIQLRDVHRVAAGWIALVASLPFAWLQLNAQPAGVAPYIVLNDIWAAAAAGLLLFAGCSLLTNRTVENPVVRWTERLSYSVYLFHFFLVDLAVRIVGTSIGWPHFVALSIVTYALAVVVALPTYLLIERPFLLIKDRFAGADSPT